MPASAEDLASCVPEIPDAQAFNANAEIPCGVTAEHIRAAMIEFTEFLSFIDTALVTRDLARLQDMLMPANFSSMVGEFMGAGIPKYCTTIAKNTYHNGHPDMLLAGKYPNNSAKHAGADGIEVKASRYPSGWQGHNVEDVWLMVFVFASGRPTDQAKGIARKPFRFVKVCGALLSKDDWKFSGRREGSRRTITASVSKSGYDKMMANWIYVAPNLNEAELPLAPEDGDEG